MRKTFPLHPILTLALTLALTATGVSGKSLVLTLTSGTQVYYLLSNDNPPTMVLANDGTLTLNGQEYVVDDIASFAISDTDYDGEAGTLDGIASLSAGHVTLKGVTCVYNLGGQMVSPDGDLSRLPAGTYIVTNGTTTLKVQKR